MDQNPNRSPFDLTSLLPLGVGVLSLFGICLILLVGRLFTPRATVLPPMTATPFKYLFMATEPGISSAVPTDTLTPDGTFEPLSTMDAVPTSTRRTGFSITAISGKSTVSSEVAGPISTVVSSGTQKATNTPFVLSTAGEASSTSTPRMTTTALALVTNTRAASIITNTVPAVNVTATATRVLPTSTSVSVAPLNAGLAYDDNDSHLLYSGDWTNQAGVPGAYKETLHVSTTLNNSVTFRFIGQELRLFFQSGPSLGRLRVTIDGTSYDVDQAGNSTVVTEWVSVRLNSATHTVSISHVSGGSVNIDQIIIPDIILTATPTVTPTSTP